MEMSPQFRQRTQTQGQQGLFKAAPFMSAGARYPRGYTPERQAEVSSALRVGKRDSAVRPVDPDPDQWGDHDRASALRENAHHERGVIDAVSRSTIPAHHLTERRDGPYKYQETAKRLGHLAVNTKWAGHEQASGFFLEHGHQYVDEPHEQLLPGHSIVLERPLGDLRGEIPKQSSLARDERTARTLIHELGHHDSHAHEDYDAAFDRRGEEDYNTGAYPAEEAYADHYAETHHRPDPRLKKVPTLHDYSHGPVGRHPEYKAQRGALEAGRLRPSEDDLAKAEATPTRKAAARSKPIAASPQWQQQGLF